MNKETFINEILNSTNGITKVNPSDNLFSKIENQLENKKVVSLKTLWLVAASVVVLISINVILLSSKSIRNDATLSVLAKSFNKNNQLY